ncbi:MAG: alpha-amylase [Chloroflexia bacterium]|nr:alpha-amylase [Chloroflexia bacterium]
MESARVTYTVRLSPRPTARIAISLRDDGVILDGSISEPGEFDGAPISRYEWSLRPNDLVKSDEAAFSSQPGRVTPIPKVDGEYLVSLTITDEMERRDTASSTFVVDQGQVRIVDTVRERAAWTEGATVYGVVVRNAGPHGYQSVIDRLDDLADLGIAAIWLAPVNVTTPGDFGYGVVDYFDLRPEYGTLDDFRHLVQQAHARNIRVLMDVVPNHTSSEHPYYRDADRHGPASPHYGFYDRDSERNTTHYFSWTHLPNLDFDNPEVRRFMTEALMYWVRELDVDGFRVDVAWGIKQRRPDFWPEFSAEFHRVKPDGLLIAEASARDPYYVTNGFDSAYDWTDELGVWAWTDIFSGETPIPTGIARTLANREGGGHNPNSFTFRFLNNNDTGPRFITTHGVDLYRVASAMLLTLPGLPCVYTGDEVGAEFEPYADPGPIDWTDHHDLRPHFRTLIHLRRTLAGLRSNHWTVLDVEPADQLFGYVRHEADGASPVLVLLNFSPDHHDAAIELGNHSAAFSGSTSLFDRYTETTLTLDIVSTADCHDELARHPPRSGIEAPDVPAAPYPAGPGCRTGARHDCPGKRRQRQSASDGPPKRCDSLTIPIDPWGIRILVPEREPR